MYVIIAIGTLALIFFIIAIFAWATNYYSLWEVWIALGIALAILAGALTVKACVNNHYKDANTKVWMVKHDVLQEQLDKDYYNKITYDGRQQLMYDIASYNSTVLMGRAKKHSKWIGVFYPEDWDSIPLIELNEEG